MPDPALARLHEEPLAGLPAGTPARAVLAPERRERFLSGIA